MHFTLRELKFFKIVCKNPVQNKTFIFQHFIRTLLLTVNFFLRNILFQQFFSFKLCGKLEKK